MYKNQIENLFRTGIIQGALFEGSEDLNEKVKDVFPWALENCPKITTDWAVKSHQKNISLIWLIYLSTSDDKELFKESFSKIVKNPSDLHTLISEARRSGIREGLGRAMKDEANKWMSNYLTDDWTCRYRNKLKEVTRLTRPKANSNQQDFKNRLAYIQFGEISFPRIKALKSVIQDMESHKVTKETLCKIKEYRIHLEEVKHKIGGLDTLSKKALFNAVAENLNYRDLILNIPAFADYVEDNQIILSKLESIDLYKESHLFPLQMLLSYFKVKSSIVKGLMTKVLEEALMLEELSEDITVHLLEKDRIVAGEVTVQELFSLYESVDSRIHVYEDFEKTGEIMLVISDQISISEFTPDKKVIMWHRGHISDELSIEASIVHLSGIKEETLVALRELMSGRWII